MTYQPKSLFRLINELNTSIFLPHIQRPFVWDEEQMRRLFDSLMRNYPIQTFLFWLTKDYIKTRRFMQCIEWDAVLSDLYDKSKSSQDVEKTFVLDGQQRLQTLYALFNGAIKSNNGEQNLEAYVDSTSGHTVLDDGLLYRLSFSYEPLSLPMYRLRDLLGRDQQKNSEEISDTLNEALDAILEEPDLQRKTRQKQVRRNIAQLVSLLREDKYFYIEELDGIANEYPYKRVLEIFVRVNSGGTKLDAADLMFAAMKEAWADIEENVEELVEVLNNSNLSFDKTVLMKCMLVALGFGAELGPEKFDSPEGENSLHVLRENWELLERTFKQFRDFITNDLKLFGNKVVRSYNSFVPIFDYLYHNPNPQPRDYRLMAGYYYKAQLFNWYRSQTDGILNVLHGIVGKPQAEGFPLREICNYFAGRYDTVLKKSHVEEIRLRFILLNIIYVQKFGSSPFDVLYKMNEPHIDHIYPQSSLKNRLGLETSKVNHIGNYRYVGARENLRKRAEMPDEYFARLKRDEVNIENHLLLSDYADNPSKLSFSESRYLEFRDQRFAAIVDIASHVVNPELTK